MPLALYADEYVDARVVAGLRRRGVDIVSAADVGLLGASDERHLDRAREMSRPVVTADHDFLRLAHEQVEEGGSIPGLIFILPKTGVGDAIRAIALLAEALERTDLHDRVEWVS